MMKIRVMAMAVALVSPAAMQADAVAMVKSYGPHIIAAAAHYFSPTLATAIQGDGKTAWRGYVGAQVGFVAKGLIVPAVWDATKNAYAYYILAPKETAPAAPAAQTAPAKDCATNTTTGTKAGTPAPAATPAR